MVDVDPKRPFTRIVAALAGLAMIGLGAAPLLRRGEMFYMNWFGGLVFAPLAIVSGVFIIGCALFKPDWLGARRNSTYRNRRR